jgi:hypothetical protein
MIKGSKWLSSICSWVVMASHCGFWHYGEHGSPTSLQAAKQQPHPVLVIMCHDILGSSTFWLMYMAANKEVD